ncbi:hypothetical protein PMIN06_006799 [Paraphaeosphaeria minitans]
MKSIVPLALAATVAALPQQSSGSDCQDSRDGTFAISVVNVTDSSTKRSVERRQLSGILTLSLEGGILKDQAGRTGYIAANHQFQFDAPVQAGALETSGFSVCGNESLALDGSAIWYQCYSGGFYNLYDESQGKQCNAIYIYAQSSGASETGAVSQSPDGQPAASTQVSAPAVSQLTDGQPQAPTSQGAAPTAPVVSQISDGQPQAPTSQAPAPSAPVVSQISDGQIQAPTSQAAAPTSAPVGVPISQISDGQVQAPTAAPSAPLVSQISDGQPQAPVATPAESTVAAPYPTVGLVSQISDGQPQAPVASGTGAGNSSGNATATGGVEFPGAATTPMAAAGAMAAGLMAMVFML